MLRNVFWTPCYNKKSSGTSRPPLNRPVSLRNIALAVCLCASLGCGVLSTTTILPPPPEARTASRQELIDTVQRIAAIQSMKAVIDITLAVQTDDRDRETLYPDVRGALVVRRPGWIRTNAQSPGGIAKVYDMVSNGEEFRVHLPWRNRVYEGKTALTHVSENRAENIRPQHMLEAIMLEPIEDLSMVVLDIEMYGQSGYQVLDVIDQGPDGFYRIRRKYWFSRSDLQLSRLMVLDENTEVATDAWYRDWLEDKGLPYPQHIRVERPQDGYVLEIEILKPGLNEEIPDASFQLTLPDNIEVERVGETTVADS